MKNEIQLAVKTSIIKAIYNSVLTVQCSTSTDFSASGNFLNRMVFYRAVDFGLFF
jgi:hypothetical protein